MRRNLFSLAMILALLALGGCRDSIFDRNLPEDCGTSTETLEPGEVEGQLVLSVPGMATSLRSLSEEQEGIAEDIHVLVFDADYTNDDRFSYEARQMATPTKQGDSYIVRLRFTKTNRAQRLVILANYPGQLPNLTKGETKSEIYKKMTVTYNQWKSDGEKTNAKKGTDYDLIPMWGESATAPITDSQVIFKDYKNSSDNKIRLYRSLVRVDVGLAFDDPATGVTKLPESNNPQAEGVKDFVLQKVYVYRMPQKFSVAGNMENIRPKNGVFQAIKPTLPEGLTYNMSTTEGQLIEYDVNPATGSLVRSIYIPEAAAPGEGDQLTQLLNATCIIVKGIYKGENFNAARKQNDQPSYYRIDFALDNTVKDGQRAKNRGYMPVLRNHRYRLNMIKVAGPGHQNIESAVKSLSDNVIYSITSWGETEIESTVTDGQYWLKVSKDHVKRGLIGGQEQIRFQTNHPGGWYLKVSPKVNKLEEKDNYIWKNTDWLKATPTPSATNFVSVSDGASTYQDYLTKFKANGPKFKSTAGKETEPETLSFSIPKLKENHPVYGQIEVQAAGGRLEWPILFEQNVEIKPSIELFEEVEELEWSNTNDPDPKNWQYKKVNTYNKSFSFASIHEEGYRLDSKDKELLGSDETAKTIGRIKVNDKVYQTQDKGVYKIFRIKVDPYDASTYDIAAKKYLPEIVEMTGSDEFYFFDYKNAGKDVSSLLNAVNKNADRNSYYSSWVSSKKLKEKKDGIPYWKRILRPMRDGTFEVAISNKPMDDEDNPFEVKRCHFRVEINIQEDNVKASAQAEFRGEQIEYNTRFYLNKECTRLVNPWDYVYLMDGKDHTLYVKSNLPYKLQITAQKKVQSIDAAKRDDVTDNNANLHKAYLAIPKGDVVTKGYTSTGSLNGEEIKFTVRDDFNDPSVLMAMTEWTVDVLDPFYKHKFEGKRKVKVGGEIMELDKNKRYIGLISAVPQPEANCYYLTLGGAGIMIPLSRINTAADYYNSRVVPFLATIWEGSYGPSGTRRNEPLSQVQGVSPKDWLDSQKLQTLSKKDDILVDVLWSDIDANKDKPAVSVNGPLKMLREINWDNERYVILFPGDAKDANEGNLVFTVRSKADHHHRVPIENNPNAHQVIQYYNELFNGEQYPILWSWHIVLRNAGQTSTGDLAMAFEGVDLVTQQTDNTKNDYAYGIKVMEYSLGATRFATTLVRNYFYKSGERKTLPVRYQWGRKDPFPNPRSKYDLSGFFKGNGGKFRFAYLGSATLSVRQSIENPTLYVASKAEWQWMTDGGPDAGNYVLYKSFKTPWQINNIWGGTQMVGVANTDNSRHVASLSTTKSVFDPSPYGFKIPAVGQEFTVYFNAGPNAGSISNLSKLKFNIFQSITTNGLTGVDGQDYYMPVSLKNTTTIKFSNQGAELTETLGGSATLNLHVSTPFSGDTNAGACFFNYQGKMFAGFDDKSTRANAHQVRSVANDLESDWEKYMNAKSKEFIRAYQRSWD